MHVVGAGYLCLGTYPPRRRLHPLRHIRLDRRGSSITFSMPRHLHALTQQYGRSAVMLLTFFFTCGTTCATGTAAHHTADGTGCDEVNSEHVPSKVPRPAGRCRGRPSCSNESGGGLLDTARRQLSPDASCREISVDTCRRVLLRGMPAHLLESAAGVGDLHKYWRRDSTLSTRLLASSTGLAEAACLGGRRRS